MTPPLAGSLLVTVSALAAIAVSATSRLRLDTLVSLGEGHQGAVPAMQLGVFLLFGVAVARITHAPIGATLVASIPASLAAQGVLLSSDVVHRAQMEPSFFDNRIYVLYADVVVGLFLASAGVGCGIVMRELWAARASAPRAAWWVYGPCPMVLGAVAIGPATIAGLAMLAVVACAVLVGLFRGRMLLQSRAVGRLGAYLARHQAAVALAGAVLLFVLTVAFNVALVRQVGPQFPLAADDGDFYDDLGWAMATDTPYRTFEHIEDSWSFRSPGYPAFVALVYSIFGRDFVALGVVQGAVGSLLPVVIWSLARRAFDSEVAAVAALLTGTSGLLVSALATLRSEAIFAVVGAVLLWALVESVDGPRRRRMLAAALAGELFAYGVLVKPQLLLFGPVAAAWWLYRAVPRGSTGSVLARMAVAGIFAAIVAAPAVARDVAVNGSPTIVGTSHATETWHINYAGARLIPLGVTRPDPGLLLEAFRRHPAEVGAILAQEVPFAFYLYFLGPWFGKSDPVQLQRTSDLAHVLNGYVLAAGLLGLLLWRAWARGAAVRVLVLLFVAVNSAVVLAIAYPAVRYRIPLDPLLFLWVAAGIAWLAREVRATRRALDAHAT